MKHSEKIWAILVHLSMHMWTTHYETLPFDDEMWDYIVQESARNGLNMIVLDVGDGIVYSRHPEISMPDAWSQERVRKEVQRCKELGIKLIPKLNFSATHHLWLGEYARMLSTKAYYQVAKDLIEEVYALFDHPEFIHLGMDEEDGAHQKNRDFVAYRQGDLLWHDLDYLMQCVSDTGARPWLWSCPLFNDPEGYKTHLAAHNAVLSPWYYNSFRPEHYTPVESRAEYVVYYNEGIYKDLGIRYVEEDPFLVRFREVALPLMAEGYTYIPCASVCNRCDYNTSDLLEYFKLNAPDEQVMGFITAPWISTQNTEKSRQYYEESFRFLQEAKAKFYP